MLLVVLTEKNEINRKPKGSTASTIVIVITITMIMLTNPCSNVRRVLTQTRLRSHTVTQSSHPHSHPVTLSTSEFLVLHSPTFPTSKESAYLRNQAILKFSILPLFHCFPTNWRPELEICIESLNSNCWVWRQDIGIEECQSIGQGCSSDILSPLPSIKFLKCYSLINNNSTQPICILISDTV